MAHWVNTKNDTLSKYYSELPFNRTFYFILTDVE